MNATIITIIVLVTCLVVAAIRKMEGSWFSPASLLGLIWTIVIVFSVISAPDYYFSVKGLLFILFNLILFFTGGKMYEYLTAHKDLINTSKGGSVLISNSGIFVLAGIVSGALAVIFLIKQTGNGLMTILDIDKMMNISKELTDDRYNGVRLSSSIMLCLTITYFSSFFAGMDLAVKPGRSSRIRLIMLMAPVTLFTLIYTARAVLLFMIFILISSYITFRPFNRKKTLILFSRFNILAVVFGVILLFGVFFFAQASRMEVGEFSKNQVEMLFSHLRVWFSGNISAFSIWFDSEPLAKNNFFSTNTFAGLIEMLGIAHRKLGIYDLAADVNYKMEFSNIYTLLRFLMDDLGIIGSGVLIFVIGAISRRLYLVNLKSNSLISGALLSGIMVMILWSFITSGFAYNSVLFAYIGFVIAIKFTEHNVQRK